MFDEHFEWKIYMNLGGGKVSIYFGKVHVVHESYNILYKYKVYDNRLYFLDGGACLKFLARCKRKRLMWFVQPKLSHSKRH